MEYKKNPAGYLIEQGTYDWGYIRMFADMIAKASPDIRKEIEKETLKVMKMEEHPFCSESWTTWENAVDLGHKYDGWGASYLYVWLNDEGRPFYVGQATDTTRASQFKYKTRSKEFQDIVRKGGCHSAVVAKHIPQSRIDELEKELISYCCMKEYPLVNNRDLPSSMEIKMAKSIAKDKNKSIENVFLEQTENREDFEKIFLVLDKIVGRSWDGKCAEFSA